MASDDDELYPEDDYDYGYDDDNDDNNDNDNEFDDTPCVLSHKPYTVLQVSEIQQRQQDEISHVSSTLSISTIEASKLLYYFNWNVSRLYDEWSDDEIRVRTTVGLMKNNNKKKNKKDKKRLTSCGICFESYPLDKKHFFLTQCGHYYCVTCWKQYITTSINDGPGCLSLRCPEPKCRVSVIVDAVIDKLATEEEKIKYTRYFNRSYIDVSKKRKWCPAPGCENAVQFDAGGGVNYDVTCLCSFAFCWNCTEEVHRPVDCDMVAKWVLKNSSESENTAWIIANSKPCPKCNRSIEKNHGCMHMTCTAPCRHEFCWLCLGAWSTHQRGSYYSCNTYKTAKQQGLYDEEETKRKRAKSALDKYTHYYERWDGNHKSRQKAIQKLQTIELDKLSDKVKTSLKQLEFISNAWEQIIECRRVLRWTYAYGYYLGVDDDDDDEHKLMDKTLFEYSQGEAEACLERLHQCAEKELSVFIEAIDDDQEKLEKDFELFRVKLIELTKATGNFFRNLVTALEKH